MNPKNGPEDTVGRDKRGWEDGESLGQEADGSAELDRGESDEGAAVGVGVGVAADEDLDDLEPPLDPDLDGAEGWEFEPYDLDDDDDDNDNDNDLTDDAEDEAEMRLLQELGIDLDAPDGDPDLVDDLAIDLDQEEPTDDGVAA
jgi:hypothetical protein